MRSYVLPLILTVYSVGLSARCSNSTTIKQKFPVMVAFTAHAYSWPISGSVSTPVQPGIVFGTEYVYSAKRNSEFLQTLNAGYFKNPDFLNAYYVNSYFTYRYTLPFKVFFDASAGLGYFHRRNAREVFKLNDDGVYESKIDWGSPGVQAGFKLATGYNLPVREKQLSLFLSYEWFIEYPHAKGAIPVLPHSLYHIGIRYQLFK